MLQPLPAETVFEAKERTRRATVRLFFLLIFLYVFFFNLMLMALFLGLGEVKIGDFFTYVPKAAYIGTALAILVAVLHFLSARSRPLQDILDQIGTVPADPKDRHHSVFLNLVEEAQAATGLRGIQAVILPTPGCNAFSLQDGKGSCAIGATEGILARLTRAELSAVVAHEAAHLVHEDSKLVTTACFLFGVFAKINGGLSQVLSRTFSSGRRRSGLPGVLIILWLVSGAGYLVTKLVSMAISREREYYADSDGVAMCKDPLSMAAGLHKISDRYRGNVPSAFSALFIMNPSLSNLDEERGFLPNLFSTHPPIDERVERLLTWARSDMKSLNERMERGEEEQIPQAKSQSPGAGNASYMLHQADQWLGPYTPLQMLAMGTLAPDSWVCPAGTEKVAQASGIAELLPLFEEKVKGARSQNTCPRCKVSLVSDDYEGVQVGQCGFCQGTLLPAGALERIIVRDEKKFTPAEIKKARTWRDKPKGSFGARDSSPEVQCPACKSRMAKGIHSMLSQVMLDRCTNSSCGSVWCDGGELETIQILMEDARKFQEG